MTPEDLKALVQTVANDASLPNDLLFAQVMVESSGDPYALKYESRYFHDLILNKPQAKAGQYGPFAACSVGLLQILVETAYELGFTGQPWDLFDPPTGLTWGAKKMAALVPKAEDYRHALAAYNAGAGNVIAGLPYADKVLSVARRSA